MTKEEQREVLGTMLLMYRKKAGVTLRDLEKKGVSNPTAQKIERGGTYKIEKLQQYAEAIGKEIIITIK